MVHHSFTNHAVSNENRDWLFLRGNHEKNNLNQSVSYCIETLQSLKMCLLTETDFHFHKLIFNSSELHLIILWFKDVRIKIDILEVKINFKFNVSTNFSEMGNNQVMR